MGIERFKGDVKRCPKSPYFIFDNDEHYKTFKYEDLKNRKVLDDIVDLLNKLNYEILVLKEDLDNSDEYGVNTKLLVSIKKEYDENLRNIISEKSRVEHKYVDLKRKYDELKVELETIKLLL